MSRMLFRLNKNNNTVIHPDAVKTVPAFRKLKAEEVQFMILYCDKFSKFHQFPPDKRLLMSKREIWGHSDQAISKHLKLCMEEYIALQYDPRDELIKTWQSKIDLLKKQMIQEENPKLIPGYVKAQKELQQECDNLQIDIDTEEELLDIEGGKKESLLEYMQRNRKLSKIKNEMSVDMKIMFSPKETGETSITTSHGDDNPDRRADIKK